MFGLVATSACSTAVGGAAGPAAAVNLSTEETTAAGGGNLYFSMGNTGRAGQPLPTDPEVVEGFGDTPAETWSLFYAARVRASDRWFHFSFGGGLEAAINMRHVDGGRNRGVVEDVELGASPAET